MKRFSLSLSSLLLLSALNSLPNIACAQETGMDVFKLGRITIEESVPVNAVSLHYEMSEEEINQLGATSAAEALDYVPGLRVATNIKGEKYVVLQGFDQAHVLVLLDGVPYYETKNGRLDLGQIPSNIIGKIEVTRGASSVLYGPNGMGA